MCLCDGQTLHVISSELKYETGHKMFPSGSSVQDSLVFKKAASRTSYPPPARRDPPEPMTLEKGDAQPDDLFPPQHQSLFATGAVSCRRLSCVLEPTKNNRKKKKTSTEPKFPQRPESDLEGSANSSPVSTSHYGPAGFYETFGRLAQVREAESREVWELFAWCWSVWACAEDLCLAPDSFRAWSSDAAGSAASLNTWAIADNEVPELSVSSSP